MSENNAASKTSDENYAVIQGWMLKQLNLKGNELLIYAIIYGFSQDGAGEFTGSLQYLADWTNSTRNGVSKCLKSLVSKGYIKKNCKVINGVKHCEYSTTKLHDLYNSVGHPIQQSCTGGVQQSCTNKQYTDNKDYIIYIVSHLNRRTGRRYNPDTPSTQKHINARLNEKYTVDDFITVIDKKCDEWLGTEFEKFLRPETLFNRTHFDDYLNQPEKRGAKNGKNKEFNSELFGQSG